MGKEGRNYYQYRYKAKAVYNGVQQNYLKVGVFKKEKPEIFQSNKSTFFGHEVAVIEA